jgi:pimeloyl-ACP methyl ester carboxylesterase
MSYSMKPMRAVRAVSQSLCIAFLLFTCGVLSAQTEENRVRNIVLVHGAWADGSGWKGVYDFLVKDGYKVSIVQEPETSFQDDVTAVKRILALQDGPCILVAHSYGGAVITEAETIYRLSAWSISRPTCRIQVRKSRTTESAFRATSPDQAP